ncbi:aminopeptidase P N-terminal domain-containing protein [Arhodomonas sp. AD133]|uniref:aminopeptidase P N-terminal domain-containing protein n=1 Tax=Arhodomonas sp. AD133 TaxID=3415009 RepID=UPI003EBA14E4
MESSEFARRRRDLMQSMGDNGIAILPAAPEQRRNRDVFYPYRQDSDFWYLTGFGEPDAVAVLAPGREQGEYILFCREREPEREIWDGEIVGQQRAVSDYGADDAFPIDDIDEILPGLIEGRERVYCTLGANAEFDAQFMGWINQVRARVRAGVRSPGEYVALEHLLHEQRLVKSAAELKVMRRAARVAAQAHCLAMQVCRPGMREYEIEAEYLAEFRRHNGEPAYPSIVGAGANACVLHYIRNDGQLRDGDLLLIDAGVELENYASDITRTFPINGRFNAEQRAVYEVVLAAQHAAIEAVHPDNHWNRPHEVATEVLVDGMLELGLVSGERGAIMESGDYRRFFMHRTGHWLGLDVHDVGDYRVDGQWRQLEPGMTLTVEPGLYIPPGSEGVDERFHGIGVRIEDDVVVTGDGCEVMTADVPKRIDEIEALMAG